MDSACNMNDTEQVLYVEMTKCSPVPAQDHWSFQADSQVNTIRYVHLCALLKALLPGVLYFLYLTKTKAVCLGFEKVSLSFPCGNNTDQL